MLHHADARFAPEPRQHRHQIEVAARDVDREQSGRLDRIEVERDRLAREQMHRYRVAAVGVDDQHVEARRAARALARERDAAVALDDLDPARALREEGEVARVARDPDHGGIDLEEAELVALARHTRRAFRLRDRSRRSRAPGRPGRGAARCRCRCARRSRRWLAPDRWRWMPCIVDPCMSTVLWFLAGARFGTRSTPKKLRSWCSTFGRPGTPCGPDRRSPSRERRRDAQRQRGAPRPASRASSARQAASSSSQASASASASSWKSSKTRGAASPTSESAQRAAARDAEVERGERAGRGAAAGRARRAASCRRANSISA